jgi:hypothetical protein
VHRALIGYVRGRVLTDERPARLASDVRDLYSKSFALLEQGLGDYSPKA